MGTAQVISSVSAGDQFSAGNAHVENAALGVWPEGLHSLRIPIHLVRIDNGDYLQFDLASPPPPDLRFDFGDAARPLVVRGRDSSAFGDTEVENAAQAVWMEGRPPERLRTPLFAREPVRVYDLPELVPSVGAVHFRLGGGPHVVPVAGFDSFETGNALVEAPLTVAPEGWLSERISTHLVRIDNGDYVRFDFDAAGLPGLALHFTFGEPRVVAGRGLDSAAFGGTEVENAAQAAWMEGRPPERVRTFAVSDRAPLWLDFVHAQEADARNLPFNFGSDRRTIPHGWDSAEFGFPEFIGEAAEITPEGWQSSSFGLFTSLLEGAFAPEGWQSSEFGIPEIPMGLGGIDSLTFGDFEVEGEPYVGDQDIGWDEEEDGPPPDGAALGAGETTQWGEAFISNYWRWVERAGGDRFDRIGELHVGHYVREVRVETVGRVSAIGAPLVGYPQTLELLSPLPMTQWGELLVSAPRILPEGFDAFATADFRVSRTPLQIYIDGFRALQKGATQIWNLKQIVQFEKPDTDPDTYTGVEFGRPQRFRVDNQHQQIFVDGWTATRFSIRFADFTLAGRVVRFTGHRSHEFTPFPDWHLIAHFERRIYKQGLDSLRIPRTFLANLMARVLADSGRETARYGRALLWRFDQYVGPPSVVQDSQGARDERFGTAWVERGQREVQMLTPRAFLAVPHIMVGLTPRRVHMEGLDSFQFENLFSTALPIPSITPHWRSTDYWDARLIGVPRLHNVTPQIYPFGRSMLRMADTRPFVSHYTRYLEPEGWDSFRFENLFTLFRDRELEPANWSSLRVNQTFRVENLQDWDPPPFPQEIPMGSRGPGEPPRFLVRGNMLGFEGIGPLVEFGTWEAFGHSVIFRASDYSVHGMFETGDAVVTGGARIIDFDEEGISRTENNQSHRVSPHTIWMTTDTPQQARANHTGRSFCPVDEFCGVHNVPSGYTGESTHPWWGTARVWMEGPLDPVEMRSRSFARVGEPHVENKIRSVAPDTIDSFFAGFPRFLMEQDVEIGIWSRDDPDTAFGEPTLTDTGPRTLEMSGLGSGGFGGLELQNQHRSLWMAGNAFTEYGDNTPMVYHYPRGPEMDGEPLTQWGDAWFSHSPRWLDMEGREHFESRWTDFGRRMRVLLWTRYARMYEGNDFFRAGRPEVGGEVARIRPYGFRWGSVGRGNQVKHV